MLSVACGGRRETGKGGRQRDFGTTYTRLRKPHVYPRSAFFFCACVYVKVQAWPSVMAQIVFAGFRPIKGIDDYFHGAALTSGDKLYAASHVACVKDGVDVHAKCHSQQGKQVYDVILHVSKAYCYTKIEVTKLAP